MSDTARIVVAAQGGDRQALEVLVARHQGRLLSFISARMASWLTQRVAAEDILQETLLESARKVAGFEPRGPTSFYRWLVGIARFKLAEAERAQQANKRSLERALDDPVEAQQTSLTGRAMRSERAGQLHRALAALPDRQAEAVRLRYFEGLTVAETAARLGCSAPAVKALVSRGLRDLSARLVCEN